MSTNAEITYAVQNDRPSITIRYSAQEEGKSKPDLCDMLSQIQEAIPQQAEKTGADITTPTTQETVKGIVSEGLPQNVEKLENPIHVAKATPKEQHIQSGMVYDEMRFLERDHELPGGKLREINDTKKESFL